MLSDPKSQQTVQLNRRRRRRRRGVAMVEFAVCLPVIVLVVLGSIEAASMLFLRQAMVQSAYEGVKVAAKPDGSNDKAISAVQAVGRGRRVEDLQIEFSHSNIARVAPGEIVTVTVSAPGGANSFIPFGPFKNRVVSARAAMVKE